MAPAFPYGTGAGASAKANSYSVVGLQSVKPLACRKIQQKPFVVLIVHPVVGAIQKPVVGVRGPHGQWAGPNRIYRSAIRFFVSPSPSGRLPVHNQGRFKDWPSRNPRAITLFVPKTVVYHPYIAVDTSGLFLLRGRHRRGAVADGPMPWG